VVGRTLRTFNSRPQFQKKQGLKYEYLKNVLLEHKVRAPVPQKQGLKPKAASSTVIRD